MKKRKKRIWLDAGHGGKDSGAVGCCGRVESDVVLCYALELEVELGRRGYEVCMSRRNNEFVELYDRCLWANNFRANVFLSLHCNDNEGIPASGFEVWYYPRSSQGVDLASSLSIALERGCVGLKNRGIKQARFTVLKYTTMPACLVELGFLNNQRDFKIITERMRCNVNALANGIDQYFNNIEN